MKPENLVFLQENRKHWITLRDAGFFRLVDGRTRDGMMRVMSEEFRPGYSADVNCPTCCANMLRELYQDFERWEAKQLIAESAAVVDVAIEISKISDPDEKLSKIKATFPSDKPKRK